MVAGSVDSWTLAWRLARTIALAGVAIGYREALRVLDGAPWWTRDQGSSGNSVGAVAPSRVRSNGR